MRLLLLALFLQLCDLATFALGAPYLEHGLVERNPLMVAVFVAFGLAGVATLKIGLFGLSMLLATRLTAKYRPTGLRLVALGGAIGMTANLIALGAILG